MDIQEATQIERNVEQAVVRAVRANIKVVVHEAVHTGLREELKPITPKGVSPSALRRTATRLLG